METTDRWSEHLHAASAERVALLAGDELLATAVDETIVVESFDALLDDGVKQRATRIAAPGCVTHLAARGARRPYELIAATRDGSVWAIDVTAARRASTQPRLLGHIKAAEQIAAIVATSSRVVVHARDCDGRSRLHELGTSGRVIRVVELPFAEVATIAALHPSRSDVLVVTDGSHQAHLVELASDAGNPAASVRALDVPRVTAVTLADDRSLLVAQKGGQLVKVPVATDRDALARACRLLCKLLEICRCKGPCGCKPAEDPGGDPGGTIEQQPDDRPGGIVDDEPCDARHKHRLTWTVAALHSVGEHFVAMSAGAERMAVFDRALNLQFERYLGRGAKLVPGSTTTGKLLMLRKAGTEAWSLRDYVKHLPGFDRDAWLPLRPVAPTKRTYWGQERPRAQSNPHHKIVVFTIIEQGQAFTDPDQSKLVAQIEPNVMQIVRDYYTENSFGELVVEFSVFGHDIGGMRKPLELPASAASYFYDRFTPGGVDAVMPAAWATPVVLDGTETMTLRSHPRVGDSKDYPTPFAALWTNHSFATYPVSVTFAGTETSRITVVDQIGATHVLDLSFGALNRTLTETGDEDAFLTAIGAHVTAAIRAAETAAGAPRTIQDIVYRRIRADDDDSRFGRLQGQFRIAAPAAPTTATQKGTIMIAPIVGAVPAPIAALGLDGMGSRGGTLASAAATRDYFIECLVAAQADAGEGPGGNDAHFQTTVGTDENAVTMQVTVHVLLSNLKGGAGATLEIRDAVGLAGTGWTTTTAVPGSVANANNTSTLKDVVKLADDVFTAALDHLRATTAWNADTARALFADFDVMMIAFVGRPPPPPTVAAADAWGSVDPVDFDRLRMFRRSYNAKDLRNPNPLQPPVTMATNTIMGQKFGEGIFDPGLLAHETGHTIGLPDLYEATGFRDDLRYIDAWEMMGGTNAEFNHFSGWSKRQLGWITDDRVVEVPLPVPTATPPVEAWLVPIEHWDPAMRADVRAVVGGTLPIAQLMTVSLGSDGGVLDFIELRSPGIAFSQNLPPTPAVLVTNGLDWLTDRRWAVNGLYRRDLHMLNIGNELVATGDKWDFAQSTEFPVKGCTAEIMEMRMVRGSIPIARVKVQRDNADFIDLFFQDNVPSWRSPDLWIDWPGDNLDPAVHRIYPEGTPTDQGEVVRFPSSGVERHYMVARVHNAGTAPAEDVKVRWFICHPPGAGDSGRWIEKDTQTIARIEPGTWDTIPFIWNVDSATHSHQCLRAEIIDWTIPTTVDPTSGDTLALGSDDVLLQNNLAQKNVFDFEPRSGSPYDPIEFEFSVTNDAAWPEYAYLCPEGLPWGSKLEVSPAEAKVEPATTAIFRCTLTLNEQIIRPGCANDEGFRLTAWRVAHDSDEEWGSCFYFVRPRLATDVRIKSADWYRQAMTILGDWRVASTQPVDLAQNPPGSVRVRIMFVGGKTTRVRWIVVPIQPNGLFQANIDLTLAEIDGADYAELQAYYDRTPLYASCTSKPFQTKQPPPIH